MTVYNHILNILEHKKACFSVLIDPDKISSRSISYFVEQCHASEVDFLLVGGSLVMGQDFEEKICEIKANSKTIPVIIFPGSVSQVSKSADALLFISLLSGRNADHIIGHQVMAAPLIKRMKIEPISTAYLLIDSGKKTSVEFMSGTIPIPNNKPEIAAAHALAAEYLGFKLIYLEAGSGATNTVPNELINRVSQEVHIPVIVGGGIKTPQEAYDKVAAGASIIVIGNHFENEENHGLIQDFANAIHY